LRPEIGVTVRLDTRWAYDGQPVARIENRHVAVDIIPTMGGKLLNLIDKAGDRNVLWRNPRVRVRPGPLQADVDDYFAGGWDDAFPTGDPCENEYGDALPYMGELWNRQLSLRVEETGPGTCAVVLEGHLPITPVHWRREIRVDADQAGVRIVTRVSNVGYKTLSFCWGTHAALAVGPGTRLDVPAKEGRVTDEGSGGLGDLEETYEYPLLREPEGNQFDVREVPEPSRAIYGLHALTGLTGGWAAATDAESKRGFALSFDHRTLPCVWQWMSYGGFRGWYHAILEPWTSAETNLDAARKAGTARELAPGEHFETEVMGVVYSGVRSVADVARDGTVQGER
jgi:hypothetical protein